VCPGRLYAPDVNPWMLLPLAAVILTGVVLFLYLRRPAPTKRDTKPMARDSKDAAP
jgi:hypothetical protein